MSQKSHHTNSQAEFWRVTSHPTKIEDKKELIDVLGNLVGGFNSSEKY